MLTYAQDKEIDQLLSHFMVVRDDGLSQYKRPAPTVILWDNQTRQCPRITNDTAFADWASSVLYFRVTPVMVRRIRENSYGPFYREPKPAPKAPDPTFTNLASDVDNLRLRVEALEKVVGGLEDRDLDERIQRVINGAHSQQCK